MSDNRDGMAKWTTENVELLRKLWADGMPAREIADKCGVTRNGLIGKAHRLGLPTHKASLMPKPVPRIRAANLPQGIEGFNELTIEEPRQTPVAFTDLERHHCRWPADAGFCGVQALDGKSYCGYHQKVATRR